MKSLMRCSLSYFAPMTVLFMTACDRGVQFADQSKGEPHWMAKLRQPPTELPPDTPKLSSLMIDEKGHPVETIADWHKRRGQLLKRWLDFLGQFPGERCELKPEIIESEDVEGCVRQKIQYEVETGCPVEAYLIMPKNRSGLLPGVVVLHSTVDYNIRQPAGLEGTPDKHIGLHLAKRGYVTLSPRCFIYDYRGLSWGTAVQELKDRYPHWRGMGKMIWDASRALDYLTTLEFVDKERIGCIGHSLGGKEALFAAAFEERFATTVSSEGGIGINFSNWEAAYYLGQDIRKPDFPMENHEVLALVAPCPFLLLGGDSADGDRSWPFIESVLPIYQLLGTEHRIGMLNHREGHAFPKMAQERAYVWFDYQYITNAGSRSP